MNSTGTMCLWIIGCFCWHPVLDAAERFEWSGEGRVRIVVDVQAAELNGRAQDEWPASLEIDFVKQLQQAGIRGLPDLRSIQVMRCDPQTGQPLRYGKYRYARSEFDRPFRWYDGVIPVEFPEFHGNVSRTKERIVRRPRHNAGFFLHTLGNWRSGRLAWSHTQTGQDNSTYAIYFDLLPAGQEPPGTPPRGWLGDGLPRCDLQGRTTVGCDHCRLDLDDWNDDGLLDLIVGENYGHLLWFPNRGQPGAPKFPYAKLVFEADGNPVDAGMLLAPKVVDWDGDGRKDLLAGTERNRILFYRNTGTNRDRRLQYQGVLQLDGQPLQVPVTPLGWGSVNVFKTDYYPVLETVDWDGDGDVDLLAGGYITGRVFRYENQGSDANGLPRLAFRGPLIADGEPLNVGDWCAAPCLADLDADGDLDLLSGCMPMGERTDADRRAFLRYYENVGGRRQAEFRQVPLPSQGDFPTSKLATPRAWDWDADGDLDLVVSSRMNIFMFENVGTARKPRFAAHRRPLPSRWGASPFPAKRFVDWNQDGHLDVVSDYTVRLNSGVGNPGQWDRTVSVLPAGQSIAHPSGVGDDWFWPYVDDFDGDGLRDVLFGDWFGHVWFHRNLSQGNQRRFDLEGYRMLVDGGRPIKVGPLNKDPSKSFVALQGARTVLTTADFDRDGRRDLVVGDTFGKVRFFRRRPGGERLTFETPQLMGDLGIRLLVDAVDWNQDGWPDVIAGAANGRVRVFINRGAKPGVRFTEGEDPGLPPIIQPRVLTADLNGDGDTDLFLPSTQGACFIERSFLERGYARTRVLSIEQKTE